MPAMRPTFRLRLLVKDEYQPLRSVPSWLWALAALALAAQVSFHQWLLPPPQAKITVLRPPPSLAALQILSLGEPITLARALMLALQASDNQQGESISFRDLDYDLVGAWLDRIVALDERAEYPHFSAAKIYATVNDEERQRQMIAWVRRQFARAPDSRWEWMAHTTHLARHILSDDALALAMAREARELTTPGKVPGWVRQMEAFFLAGQGEYESSAALIAGLLAAGEVTDPTEFEFLLRRLEEIITKQVHNGDLRTQSEIAQRWQTLKKLQQMFLAQYGGEINIKP